MATSVVDICNSALVNLGAGLISSLTENNDRARACNQFYDNSRDVVLTQAEWNFATHQQTLSKLSAEPLFGFAYAYLLPTNPYCLKALKIENPEFDTGWKIKGRQLHSDRDGINLEYIFRNTDVSQYSPLFEDALSYYLASKMAYAITGSRAIVSDMFTIYEGILADAQDVNAQEGMADDFESDDLITVRR